MEQHNLTLKDVDILLDALDAWFKKETADAIQSGLIGEILTSMGSSCREDATEKMKNWKACAEKEVNEAARRGKDKERQATILKAKLYELQEQLLGEKSGLKVGKNGIEEEAIDE